MNHPWGLSGPEFLWLYGAGLVVALGFAVVVRWRVRRPSPRRPVGALGDEALAFLVGGPHRVAETVVARLVGAGALRPSREGTLAATTDAAGGALEHEVLRSVGSTPRRVAGVLAAASGLPGVAAVGEALGADGFLLSPARVRRARALSMVGVYLVLGVGLVRFVNGAVQDLPVGYLALLLVLTAALIGWLHLWKTSPRTVHGEEAVLTGRGDSATRRVALGGLIAYPDLDIRYALCGTRPEAMSQLSVGGGPQRRRRGGFWAAGGSSCGGGSSVSCGGGSSSSGGGSSCGGGGGCGGGSS